jgi:hypothetical protein
VVVLADPDLPLAVAAVGRDVGRLRGRLDHVRLGSVDGVRADVGIGPVVDAVPDDVAVGEVRAETWT